MPTEYMGRDEGQTNNVTREYPVANGVTVTEDDFVYLNADGRVSNAVITGAARLLGTVVGTDTQNLNRAYGRTAVGNAAGTVKVLVNIERDARYLVTANAALAEANVGDALDLTGATGAQVIDVAKATPTGQVVVLQLGTGIRGRTNTSAVVRIAKHQLQT